MTSFDWFGLSQILGSFEVALAGSPGAVTVGLIPIPLLEFFDVLGYGHSGAISAKGSQLDSVPFDLAVVDPAGNIISRTVQTASNALFFETDGGIFPNPIEVVLFKQPTPGVYSVTINDDTQTTGGGTFSVIAGSTNEVGTFSKVLLEDGAISGGMPVVLSDTGQEGIFKGDFEGQ